MRVSTIRPEPTPGRILMDKLCHQEYTRARSALRSIWRSVQCVKHTGVIFWSFVIIVGFACVALCAGLSTVTMAQVQPIAHRIIWTDTQSVYLIEPIAPYAEECTLDGISTVDRLPPELIVEYAKSDAYCSSNGDGNGRLTLLVTGKCRLVRWQTRVIESVCTRLPLVVN